MTDHRVLVARRTWLMPILLIAGLATALPAIYLSATADPIGHLKQLPMALVVKAQEASAGAGSSAATSVADALEELVDDAISMKRMTPEELDLAMREDRVAGAIVIGSDFDASIASLLPNASVSSRPTVVIQTNSGDGGLSNGLVVAIVTPLLKAVSDELGAQLVEANGGVELLPANLALLSEPFGIAVEPFERLPATSGLGTSAFYYSLILVLIAFIGASLVNPLVDAALGVIPSELGPLIALAPFATVSRRRTYLAKAAILVAAAPIAAAVVQAVSAATGVTASNGVTLWLFSTLVIAAIGVSALAVFAVLGQGIGSLVNTLFFVALSMVSSGGIVPLEATPTAFQTLSSISPFRWVVEGSRSLFYFDGHLGAGLGAAWAGIAIVGFVGLAIGVVATTLYGRVPKFRRQPHRLER